MRIDALVHPMNSQPLTPASGDSPGTATSKRQGKKKIAIELIEDKFKRQTTLSKRKAGLLKKASELQVLTGCSVLVLVSSDSGHVHSFAGGRFRQLLECEGFASDLATVLSQPVGTPQSIVSTPALDGSLMPPPNDGVRRRFFVAPRSEADVRDSVSAADDTAEEADDVFAVAQSYPLLSLQPDRSRPVLLHAYDSERRPSEAASTAAMSTASEGEAVCPQLLPGTPLFSNLDSW